MMCNTQTLTTTSQAMSLVGGSSALGSFQSNVLAFYTSVDSARTFKYAESDDKQAVNQVLMNEIQIAAVQPDLMRARYPTEFAAFIESGDVAILPTGT